MVRFVVKELLECVIGFLFFCMLKLGERKKAGGRGGSKVGKREKGLGHRFECEVMERKSFERDQNDQNRETTEEKRGNFH
jgi:hypothetical protein